jgi:hypothetical protein
MEMKKGGTQVPPFSAIIGFGCRVEVSLIRRS